MEEVNCQHRQVPTESAVHQERPVDCEASPRPQLVPHGLHRLQHGVEEIVHEQFSPTKRQNVWMHSATDQILPEVRGAPLSLRDGRRNLGRFQEPLGVHLEPGEGQSPIDLCPQRFIAMRLLEEALRLPTAEELHRAKREVKTLRSAVARARGKAKVEVSPDTLRILVKVIGGMTLRGPARADVVASGPPVQERLAALSEEISPQEAAEILQMSRPSVMRLIDKGLLHPRKIHSRNKLSRAEVLAYQRADTETQRVALESIARLTEEYDF
jgi:hypothetical protein